MTLLWFDGFENYSSTTDYNVVASEIVESCNNSNGSLNTYGTTQGRNGRGLRMAQHDAYHDFNLLSSYSTDEFVLGFAFKKAEVGAVSVNTGYPFIKLRDFSGGSVHLTVALDATLNFKVYRNVTLLGTTSGKTVSDSVWHYFEIKVKIHDSAGTVEIWLDGTKILNLSSQDTLNGSNAYVRHVRLASFYNDRTVYFDDLYFLDTDGDAPYNDRLSDVKVDILRPDGAGSHTDFTPSAGSNYQNVDEVGGPDDDTTYNDGDAVAEQDSYAIGDLSSGGTIFGVKSIVTCRKTDSGGRGYKILTRSGGTDYKSNEINPASTFETQAKIYQINPDDSAAWEEADVNGMEVGVEITT